MCYRISPKYAKSFFFSCTGYRLVSFLYKTFFVFLKLTVSLYLSAHPLSEPLPSTATLKTEGFKK